MQCYKSYRECVGIIQNNNNKISPKIKVIASISYIRDTTQ